MREIELESNIKTNDEVISDLYDFLTGDKPTAKLLRNIISTRKEIAEKDLQDRAKCLDGIGYIIVDQQRKGVAIAYNEVADIPEMLRMELEKS